MKRLLVVAHAPSPNTQRLLDALLDGARDPEAGSVDVVHRAALQAGPDDVRACDAIVLFTTENLGYMSGALKDFFDRTYYPVLEEKQGLPCAVLIRAGHDGTGTRRALESILAGLRWKPAQEPCVLRGAWDEAFMSRARELGMTMAAGLDAGVL